ncbi:uncharacterized protein [Apostichopus japonicus]|uniref:uncharacterized protein isoform X3 n=1 Tax=Stichopus japonicus TaxID=307972 RepID=UPI003AB5E9D9
MVHFSCSSVCLSRYDLSLAMILLGAKRHALKLDYIDLHNIPYQYCSKVSANVSWETTNQHGNYVLLKKSYVANITCRTEGNPAPVTYLQMFQPFMQEWQNASVEDIVLTKKEDVIFSSFLYNINNMTSVTVRCVSFNGVDQSAYSTDIHVYYFLEADVDLMHQKTMEVSQNHIVILVCQASGFPIPNVNLQRINTLYEWESLSYQPHINESESLWWYELKEYSDRDAYRCLANNTVDEFATSEVVVLSVIGGINPLPTDSTQLLLIMLISSVAVVFFICILIILVCKKYLLSLGDDTGFTRNTDTVTVDSGKKKTENLDTVELYCTIPNDTGTVNNDTMLLIPEKDLTFGKQLKRSALRQRWKGNFRKESSVIDVHVSSCRCDQQETDEWTSFIRCIRQLPSHTNIVKLLGQCVRVDTTYCVHEDLSYGTLRSYLESEYGESFQSYTTLEPVPSKFFSLAIGATLGMKHLHFHRWIHPGLCARKVLLTQGGKSCKLYDFCSPEFAGVRIEAEIQECNPYVNIPSEVLAQKEYTQMSDIWAVGVLIWELFSYGAHLPTHKEVAQNERHGMELCKPEKCPKNIYDAILDSWKHDPRSRPTLMELEHEMTQASAFYALNTDNKAVCSSFKVPNVTDQ